ncbi:U-box domain-containing protein 4 [Apostasia shenzhenica]|uniref:U-box domain-containing protein 4 n=1 Tax=Apostasia shenzhenica TaxID=1088818 RepID=A0A2I0B7A2_9ASPA|nr:U-box domain-containing protein 4 [Apostasia shenzhenica]
MKREEFSAIHLLINSLISSTYFITSFPSKWQSITNKLEKLNSNLKASRDSLPMEFLPKIWMTLTDMKELADHCGDGSYSGGKLLMKSDIDKALSRLDVLIHQLAEINDSGSLMQIDDAIVVAKPAAGAGRDDMRFYMKELFLRLRIGGLEMKVAALAAINEILHEDEKYAVILLVEVDDGVVLLVSLLEFQDVGVQEEALGAVVFIAGFDAGKGALVAAGVISPLVRILEGGSRLGKVRAASALNNLTENADNAWSVSSNGGVTALIRLIGDSGRRDDELVHYACKMLQNLSRVMEMRRFMVEQGVISAFCQLLASPEDETRIWAIEFLVAIASEDDEIKGEIARGGAADRLLKFLNPSSSFSLKERELALTALEISCFSEANSISALICSEFLNWVFCFLNTGEILIQEVCLKAMLHFCEVSEEAKKAMGDSEFIPVVLNLLKSKSIRVCELAAELLVKLLSVQKTRKKFLGEAQNVNLVLELLIAGEEVMEKKRFLLPLITSLSNSSSGRRKIAASGYVKDLQKLAEADSADAKKIVKKITGSRFRSLFQVILSI